MTSQRGLFISLEGIDGAGKSSHLQRIAEQVAANGYQQVLTREPGGTKLAETLRTLVLHESMRPDVECLLMFAARRDHIDRVIAPALARGEVVICDRFTDATMAYQGGGRGMNLQRLEALAHWVLGDLKPDLTLLFDVPVTLAAQRLAADSATRGGLDRFELEKMAFFEAVRSGYLAIAESAPERVKIVNAAAPMLDVAAAVARHIDGLLARHPHGG